VRRRADLESTIDAAVETLRCEDPVEELTTALLRAATKCRSGADAVVDVGDDEPQAGLSAQTSRDAKRLFGFGRVVDGADKRSHRSPSGLHP
jgi:hypothetical protein